MCVSERERERERVTEERLGGLGRNKCKRVKKPTPLVQHEETHAKVSCKQSITNLQI